MLGWVLVTKPRAQVGCLVGRVLREPMLQLRADALPELLIDPVEERKAVFAVARRPWIGPLSCAEESHRRIRPYGQLMAQVPTLSASQIQGVSDVLGMTSGGLSNDEIGKLLAEAGIDDPTPKAPPGTYIAVNKRTRLFNALKARQDHDRSSSAVLRFIEIAMAPIRYAEQGPLFDERRGALNERLLHIGIEEDETGKLNTVEKAATVSEARQRTRRLRGDLEERGVHPKVLAACDAEIADENYFHIVLEAAKSLADEIRQKAGLDADGTTLIGEAFDFEKGSLPRLAWNSLETITDRSEHTGLTHLCRGVVGAFRNPTAHEPKISWEISETEALDVCSLVSLLHRRLEGAAPVPESLRGGAPA
jgi:uncharacterized protein (TIGR02391 family)